MSTDFSSDLGASGLNLIEEILGHLVTRYADQVCVEFKSLVGFESDVYLLLRLGINDSLMVIKSEALLEDLLYQVLVMR